ncbi:hypothetical protein BC827DRAFT_829885 [Russula dissimulans]|jgi:hypothetical protein|nr:hypothetical protein BC827DRAFT_829885 [Russula dissimulans]
MYLHPFVTPSRYWKDPYEKLARRGMANALVYKIFKNASIMEEIVFPPFDRMIPSLPPSLFLPRLASVLSLSHRTMGARGQFSSSLTSIARPDPAPGLYLTMRILAFVSDSLPSSWRLSHLFSLCPLFLLSHTPSVFLNLPVRHPVVSTMREGGRGMITRK